MSTVEINLDDYLSEQEKKDIAIEVFRGHCLEKFQKDSERIFSNAAYTTVAKLVDEQIEREGGNLDQIIRDKAIQIIGKLSEHSVFKRADHWEKEESAAYKFLQKAVDDNAGLINTRVIELFKAIDQDDLAMRVADLTYRVIEDRLIGKQN